MNVRLIQGTALCNLKNININSACVIIKVDSNLFYYTLTGYIQGDNIMHFSGTLLYSFQILTYLKYIKYKFLRFIAPRSLQAMNIYCRYIQDQKST